MTPEIEHKVKRCGALLAQSPLADEIKDAVIRNVGQMTEAQLDLVIKSLKRETMELASITEILKSFDKKQEEIWTAFEKKQEEAADKAVEDALSSL